MADDVYQAPDSEVLVEPSETQEFYVVSLSKAMVLFYLTMGMYILYWNFKHWQQFKTRHQNDIWPIPRAIFAVFFTHSLFAEIKQSATDKNKNYQWAAGIFATIIVVTFILSGILTNLSMRGIGQPITDALGLLILPLQGWIIYNAQKHANFACGDADGNSNSSYTGLNILWIVLGIILWLFTAIGLFALFMGLA